MHKRKKNISREKNNMSENLGNVSSFHGWFIHVNFPCWWTEWVGQYSRMEAKRMSSSTPTAPKNEFVTPKNHSLVTHRPWKPLGHVGVQTKSRLFATWRKLGAENSPGTKTINSGVKWAGTEVITFKTSPGY